MAGTTHKPFPAVSVQLGVAASVIYTCPAGTQAVVNKLSAVNSTVANRTLTVYVVRSGDAPAVKNLVCNAMPVLASTSAECLEIKNLTLAPGDTIQALADAATAVSPAGSVTEYLPS